jgi:hypothetical protein
MAVVGPFPAHEKEAFRTPFPPEWDLSSDTQFRSEAGVVRWVELQADHQAAHDGIDFEALWGQRDHAAGYAMARVRSRTAREAELRIGADDTITVWLNGRQIFAKEVYRLADWDQEVVPITLNPGDNTLVFKIAQDRNPWRLLPHLSGPAGSALEGVTDSLDTKLFAADRPAKGPVLETPAPLAWHIAGPVALKEPDKPQSPGQLDGLAASPDPLSVNGITWRTTAEIPSYAGVVDLIQLLGRHHHADAYAIAEWTVARPTPVEFRAGSDDGLVMWLNGRRIHASKTIRGYKRGEDKVRVTLRPGRNVLMCRIRQGDGEWKFGIEVWDVSAVPYRPLEPSSRP